MDLLAALSQLLYLLNKSHYICGILKRNKIIQIAHVKITKGDFFMLKIKMFDESHELDLEDEVKEFIDKLSGRILDIN